MNDYTTIWETVTLPSKGLIYDKQVNPTISLRSMTVAEEMKKLSPTETPYKVMCDIIEDCMKEKPEIHVCEMSFGDYQFLLHKLRIITYGPEYKMTIKCPKCGSINDAIADLDSLEVKEYDDSVLDDKIVNLPKTNHQVELKFQTPRDLDIIAYKNKEKKKEEKSALDYSFLFTLMSLIKTVDGRTLNSLEMEDFIKNLPLRDANFLLNKATKLTEKIGITNTIEVKCSSCGCETVVPFRVTSEFLEPSEN